MGDPKSFRRNTEIEEPSNLYLIHPISARLVPIFYRLGIHPNTVSILGAVSGALAAVSYFHFESTLACALGLFFMIGWHVLDGADGQLARMSNKVTPAGFVIDGICDYATFILVYLSLGIRLTPVYGLGVWALVGLAGLSHIVQAASFELQRAVFISWTGDHPRPAEPHAPGSSLAGNGRMSAPFSRLADLYAAVQRPFHPLNTSLSRRLTVFRTQGAEGGRGAAQIYRETFRAAVLRWSLLSANNRSLAIFLFCVAGYPIGYFVFEILALNAVLIFLLTMNRRQRAALDRRLTHGNSGSGT